MTNTRTAGRLLTRLGSPQLLYLRTQSSAPKLSLENHGQAFGALPSFVPCATARHNLATSFTRALLRTHTLNAHSSKRHHARKDMRPSVLCIRSTMSNSQRTSADLRPIPHSRFLLSQSPEVMVGQGRFELPTSRLSSARSNQLSY